MTSNATQDTKSELNIYNWWYFLLYCPILWWSSPSWPNCLKQFNIHKKYNFIDKLTSYGQKTVISFTSSEWENYQLDIWNYFDTTVFFWYFLSPFFSCSRTEIYKCVEYDTLDMSRWSPPLPPHRVGYD